MTELSFWAQIALSILVLLSAVLSLAAAVGLLKFPDVLYRLHAATKPQILGLLVALVALCIVDGGWAVISTSLVIMVFQLLTQPVAAHMVTRSAYRTRHIAKETLLIDELAPVVDKASSDPVPSAPDTDEEVG